MRIRCIILALAIALGSAANAQQAEKKPLTPEEIETYYRKGQVDWDAGEPIAAMPNLKIAADAGHPVAQYLLGYLLDAADDDELAAAYYRKSADQGNLDALYSLASFTAAGDGGIKIDVKEARSMFAKAAEKMHVPSLSVLVMAYAKGGLGLSDADRKGNDALYWYRKGAEVDLIPATEKIYETYRDGLFGVPKDPAEAERWRLKLFALLGVDPNAKKKRVRR